MGRKILLMWLLCCLLLDVSVARSIEILPAPSTWTPEFVVDQLEKILFKKPEGSAELAEAEIYEVTLHNNTVIVSTNGVPRSVYQAFNTMKDDAKHAFLRQEFNQGDAFVFGNLPAVLLSILPVGTLNATNARQLSTAVRINWDNLALAEKLIGSIGQSSERQQDFLSSLDAKLTSDVQRLCMEVVTKWWPNPRDWKQHLGLLVDAGDIMLAEIPSEYLKSIPEDALTMFVDAIASATDIKAAWKHKSTRVKKSWYDAAIRAKYVGPLQLWDTKKTIRNSFLLEAAPANILRSLRFIDEEQRRTILSGTYNDMQIRALFDVLFSQTQPTVDNLDDFDHRVFSLYPMQQQQFPFEDGEFRFLARTYNKKRFYFYPSILQLAYLLYPLQSDGGVERWGAREMSEIGPLLHALPVNELRKIKSTALDWRQRSTSDIASPFLSTAQSWMLMSKIQQTVDPRRDFPDYLRFVPVPLHVGIPTGILVQNFMRMMNTEILPIMVSVFDRMLPSQQQLIYQQLKTRLGDVAVLRSILDSHSNGVMNMLPPNKTVEVMTKMLEMRQDSFEPLLILRKQERAIKNMPRRTLSIWLNHVRTVQQRDWMAEDFFPRTADAKYRADYAILGLTCTDVEMMGDLQLIPIVSKYRKVLAETKDGVFSTDLMHCMLKRMVMDFHLKKELKDNNVPDNGSTLSLISAGEAIELGPILTLIPESEIMAVGPSTRKIIMESIGQVDIPTLMSATHIEKLQWLAQQYIKDVSEMDESLSSAHWFHKMGTLYPFITPEMNISTETGVLKDYLEMHDGRGDKMFCISPSLQTFWQGIIEQDFGPAQTWNGSDIVLMGDLLLWLSTQQLENLREDAIIDSLSVWLEKCAITKKLVQKPGLLITMLEACQEQQLGSDHILTAFSKLGRKMIRSAKSLVDTILTPRDLVNKITGAPRTRPRRQTVIVPNLPPTGRDDQFMTVGPPGNQQPPPRRVGTDRQLPPPMGNEGPVSTFDDPGQQPPPRRIGTERQLTPPMGNEGPVSTFDDPGQQLPRPGIFEPARRPLSRPDQPNVMQPPRPDLPNTIPPQFIPDQPVRNDRLFPVEPQPGSMMPETFGEGLNITCETLKTIQPFITVITEQDFLRMPRRDFVDCLEIIGAEKWNKPTSRTLFNMLKTILEQQAEGRPIRLLPELLLTMGSLSKEIISNDHKMVDLQLMPGVDTVAIMGRLELNIREVELLSTKFLTDNKKFIENIIESQPTIRAVVLASLGNIAGGLPPREINGILNSQQGMYWELSPLLGRLMDATPAVLRVLADFAVAEYGDPSTWTEHTVSTIGTVMAGMSPDVMMQLGRKRKGDDPLQGLTVSAVKMMTPSLLQDMTEDQLASLPWSVVQSLSDNQMKSLSAVQKEAISRAQEMPSFIPSEWTSPTTRASISTETSTGQPATQSTSELPTTTLSPQEAAQQESSSGSKNYAIVSNILVLHLLYICHVASRS